MVDERVKRLASVLAHYCAQVKKGERVLINGSTESAPLLIELQREILQKGGFPVTRVSLPGQSYNYYKYAKKHHLEDLSPISMYETKQCQAVINIYDSSNTKELASIDSKKIAMRRQATQPISEWTMKHVRWCVTMFPTKAHAQDADMSLAEFEDFVFGAAFCDQKNPVAAWKALGKKQQKLADRLNKASMIQITGKETDLTMSVKGMKFINSDGRRNMPSGEVFTAPIKETVEGTVLFDDFPSIYAGKEVQGVFLRFKKGKVVEASAEKNEKFLLQMLDMDKGARYLGELGIGTNFKIQRFSKTILFDEKIGGSIHLALGRAYEECGGTNKSTLHWDMIKDLRKHGCVYVDGKPMVRKGDEMVVEG